MAKPLLLHLIHRAVSESTPLGLQSKKNNQENRRAPTPAPCSKKGHVLSFTSVTSCKQPLMVYPTHEKQQPEVYRTAPAKKKCTAQSVAVCSAARSKHGWFTQHTKASIHQCSRTRFVGRAPRRNNIHQCSRTRFVGRAPRRNTMVYLAQTAHAYKAATL
jgi:hypothetical protein